MTHQINSEMIAIMKHTAYRAANGMYCGNSPDMKKLVENGLMEFAGKAAWCPDEYFRLTKTGRELVDAFKGK